MKANQCKVNIFTDPNPVALSEKFNAWVSGLPEGCVIEGQPYLSFSAALQKFIMTCLYEEPSDDQAVEE